MDKHMGGRMPGMPEITLKDYFEKVLSEQEKQMDLHFRLLDQALTLNKTDVEQRLAHLNELRGEVEKDRSLFMTRIEYDAKHEVLMAKLDGLSLLISGKASQDIVDKLAKLVYVGVGI